MKAGAILLTITLASGAGAQHLPQAERPLAREVFQELIETNTSHSVGSTTAAAEAMQRRLLAAGFRANEIRVIGPSEKRKNLLVRYTGRQGSSLKPVLFICHLDVVEAKREDWTTDPFKLVEKDGYFYGRGTQDIKQADAGLVASFIRLRREGFVPERDIYIALTADEERGLEDGVEWLLKNVPELKSAEFAINPDAGSVYSEKGKPAVLNVEATEKTYADFHLSAVNKGGHSSLPTPDNAIYHVTDALSRVEKSPFPVELNSVTRVYFERMAGIEKGKVSEDMHAVLRVPMDAGAAERLSMASPTYNAMLRTTCVATMMKGGHAPNALPQSAEADVNCRILPGHTIIETRDALVKIVGDPEVKIACTNDAGDPVDVCKSQTFPVPAPVNAKVSAAMEEAVAKMWPGLPVVPVMLTGASDSVYTMSAGIPTYGISGFAVDKDDIRFHGKDERLRVESYYDGVEFTYQFLKALTGN